jgi:hypothetical protein
MPPEPSLFPQAEETKTPTPGWSAARQLYPKGKGKRGHKTEWDYFRKTHKKTWRQDVWDLVPAIEVWIAYHKVKDGPRWDGWEHLQYWPGFKKLIYNRLWEEAVGMAQELKQGRVGQ